MQRIVGIGHSHLHPVSRALTAIQSTHPGLFGYTPITVHDGPLTPCFRSENGKRVPNPAWMDYMREHMNGPNVTAFLCLGGSEWWRWSLTPGPRPYDFVDPNDDDGAPLAGEVIPYSLVWRRALDGMDFLKIHVEYIRMCSPAPLMQFLPPPPARDVAATFKSPGDLEKATAGYGVSSPAFRLKIWRLCARALEAACAEIGVEFVPLPEGATDADGFLRQDLVSDPVHGTTAWGHMLCRRILRDIPLLEGAA